MKAIETQDMIIFVNVIFKNKMVIYNEKTLVPVEI